MIPVYLLSAPPHLAAALASGAFTPMATSGGLMTTLVNTSGTIVGTAHLVPASGAVVSAGASAGGASGASALVAGSSIALGPALLVAGGVCVVGLAGVLAYRRYKNHARAKATSPHGICLINEWQVTDDIMAEAHRILDEEAHRLAHLADIDY